MSEVVVNVHGVVKEFSMDGDKSSSLKAGILGAFKKKEKKKSGAYRALDGVSFDVKQGEFFGIVGRNGSGKSTLLKIISEIYQPNEGSVSVKGKLVPFIELGVGFNPELTGRENVFLNGALLGFSRKEMEEKYDEIVAFAELERFMDQKLKNYSSGMQVRLAFSVAIKAQGDVLIFDEVLAVGDEAFQNKCDNYFDQVKKDKTKTVILVTHSMDSVKKYCDRAVLIKNGKVALAGSPDDVSNQYTEDNLSSAPASTDEDKETGLSDIVPLLKISPVDARVSTSAKPFKFNIEYDYLGKEDIYLAFSIDDIGRGGVVYDSGMIKVKLGKNKITYEVPLAIFNSSNFKIIATIRTKGDDKKYKPIAFTSEVNSLMFSIRNDISDSSYALLNKEEFIVKEV